MRTHARFQAMLLMLLFVVFFTCVSVAGTNVKVMTYNVDEGTDFAAITAVLTNPNASPADFEAAVGQTINEVLSANLPGRAQLIANEIAASQLDLVGLQEAAVWTFGSVQLDLRQMILDQLGQQYVVVTVPEFQLNITQLGVGFMDQDVILARTDLVSTGALTITAKRQGHYNSLVPLPAFPPYLPATSITRNWAYVDAKLNGTAFRFITTHLEDGTNSISPIFALVQALQEIQLVYSPALTLSPVIIAGDLNTIANDPSSPTFLTYRFMLANGFTDAWRKAHPYFAGATCCQTT
jgi:endonuclease/exonuclease/phosphatase family metal-dependent hydrolase